MSPAEHELLNHPIKVSRAVLLAGAELLPLWPGPELRGLKRIPPLSVPAAPVLELVHVWSQQCSCWRCRVCLRVSRALSNPLGGPCPGQSRLDQGQLERLGHRVIAFPCSDGGHLFLCMSCKFYTAVEVKFLA
eukprot:7922592-Pyramimonas_sp.AAC.1